LSPSAIRAARPVREEYAATLAPAHENLAAAENLAVADRILVLERGRIIHEDRREDADVARITGYLSV
jgi:urea transport system ATP-binding protein